MSAILAVTLVIGLAAGVRPLEILAFAAYEAVFVIAPGVLVLRAVIRTPGSFLSQLAIGWPLGCCLELAAFSASAAIGARWLLFLYPPAACGAAAWVRGRRSSGTLSRGLNVPSGPVWATAAVIAVVIALVGIGPFATYPLPRSTPSVVLYKDHAYTLSLAAEARHHWPITDPNVSGEPLRYYVFVFMDAAAIQQTTGIPLDVIMLRLQPLLFVLLVGLQLAWLARRAARASPWVAPGAVAIMLLANELDVDIARPHPFRGQLFEELQRSSTFALGLAFFIPAAGILLVALTRQERLERGTWVVLAALLVGAVGAKASTLPVLLAALGLFVLARAVIDRAVDRRALAALGLILGLLVVVYLALFSGGGAEETGIRPGAFLYDSGWANALSGPVAMAAGGVAVTLGLVAPWAGSLLLIGRVRGTARLAALWLSAIAIAALVPFLVLGQGGGSQIWFLLYGAPAAAVLSAWGIARAWPEIRGSRHPLVALTAVLAASLCLMTVLYATARSESITSAVGYLAAYAGLIAVIVLVVALIARLKGWAAFAGASTLLVAVTLLDVPIDVGPRWIRQELTGQSHHQPDRRAGPRGIDTQLLAGLRWLRDHSSPRDVLAVQVQRISDTGPERNQSRYFMYSAYAERRTFLGGWDYSGEAHRHKAQSRPGLPFVARRTLNDAAFRGDRRALEILRDKYGVRYLLVDLRHQPPNTALDRRLPRIYATAALRIYRVEG